MSRLKFAGRALSLLILALSPLAHADVLSDVLERRVLRVGVAEFMPWTMTSESGDLIGFEIDVAKKIAADMGVEARFRVYDFERLIPAVQQGEIDLIAGGMEITPRRALQVNFTQPLANSGVSMATNKEKTKNVSSLDDLNDERAVIAVVTDTLAHGVARAFFDQATIRMYTTGEEAVAEILEGRAHAYLASVPEVNFLALMNSAVVDVPLSEPILASTEGLAVKKGEQELLNFLNAWVVSRQADRWLSTTREYWFETIDWARVSSD